MLPLASDDPAGFLAYVDQYPAHTVRLWRRGAVPEAEWTVLPWSDGQSQGYRLTFRRPDHVESWISENEDWRAKRAGAVKEDLLSSIIVYRRSGEEMRIYQLRYEPAGLRQPRL